MKKIARITHFKLRFNPQCKYMTFMYLRHIYIYIYTHHLRAHNRPTKRPAPSWPDSSTGRARHRHRRGQGSNSVQGFLVTALVVALKKKQKNKTKQKTPCEDHILQTSFQSAILIHDFHLFTSDVQSSTFKY